MTWLIPQSLRSAFAPASACSISAFSSPSPTSDERPALWVTLSGTPSLRPASWHGWKTRLWSRRLYGPETCRMSDGNAGLDAWTESLRASRANRTAWPATAKAPVTTAGRGRTSSIACAWFDPASHSWKTSPACDLLGDWMPFSRTWPRSGSLSNGTVSERETWAPATSASESSFWPTATTCGNYNRAGVSEKSGDGLSTKATQWQTPATPKGGMKSRGGKRCSELLLPGQAARFWATPMASDDGHKVTVASKQNSLIRQAHQFWPTPASRDHKGENSAEHLQNGTGRLHLDQLPNFVKFCWPTPAASDSTRGGQQTERMTGQTLVQTVNSLCSHPVLSIHDGAELSPTTRTLRQRLNPAFACWLMGWPTWWTSPGRISSAASEMELWRSRLISHLSRLLGERELLEEAA